MPRETTQRTLLDYRGTPCPYNYVKAKLFLEEAELGEIIEIVVDEGEPSRHVPKSLKNDGQAVLESFVDGEGAAHFVIQKTAEY